MIRNEQGTTLITKISMCLSITKKHDYYTSLLYCKFCYWKIPCGDGWEVYKGTCPDGNKLLKNLELKNLGWKD